MKFFICIVILFLAAVSNFSQTVIIAGRVTDKGTGTPLSFANIRIANTTIGTSSNKNGDYELKAAPGEYKLVVSYIGYISDTIYTDAHKDISGINFSLEKTNITLEEIVVLPGENPAIGIIRKAIQRKNQRNEKLHSYEFEAYTKGIIRSKEDIRIGTGRLGLGVGDDDSVEMKITGIVENQSIGYFTEPDNYKEIITARKQTANLPPSLNILTGGRLIKNFYEDNIDFFGRGLPGPLADDALDYYYYFIEGQVHIDSTPVFIIHVEPDISSDPGFTGTLFITDSSFDMIKIDLQLNRAANTGGLFDTINIFQQFLPYSDSIYMPADYRLIVSANIFNLVQFGVELNTILHSYKINPAIDEEFFDKVIVQVLPEADKKDTSYWLSVQSIPNTLDEQSAYKRIDSINNVPLTFWDRFSILSPRIYWTDHFSTSSPLYIYHYNKVEGHALDFGLWLSDAAENRLNTSLNFSYGFADKKMKEWLSASYLFGNYRTTELSINAYERINILFGNSDNYNEIFSTILALFAKYEFRDYYYSNGFDINFSSEVFPVLELNAGFSNHTDKNAQVNTQFAIFGKGKSFEPNQQINEAKINSLSAGFVLDFRDYIEDGLFRRRISSGSSDIILEGNISYSDSDLLKSSLRFTKYELDAYGLLKTFNSAGLNYRIHSQYTSGTTPYQMLYALPGNVDVTAQRYTFRTLNVNEIVGQNLVTVNLEHDWSDLVFRALGIPLLKTLELQLTTYLNAAYSDVNAETKAILPAEIKTFKSPFYEIGFAIGHVLLPLRLDFAWKLNYRGENNFRVGIQSILL